MQTRRKKKEVKTDTKQYTGATDYYWCYYTYIMYVQDISGSVTQEGRLVIYLDTIFYNVSVNLSNMPGSFPFQVFCILIFGFDIVKKNRLMAFSHFQYVKKVVYLAKKSSAGKRTVDYTVLYH